MVTREDIRELNMQINPEICSIQRMAGAYVATSKVIVTTFNQKFLTLPDNQYHKYLKLIKEVYAEKGIGEHIITLDVKNRAEGACQADMLNKLIEKKLEDESDLEDVYANIIDTYQTTDSYLILFLYAVYDIMERAKDGTELDSEEVYEHIQCLLIPLKLEKEGLQYNREKNSILPIDRDWIVTKVAHGFVYPALEERTAEPDHVMYYTKSSSKTAPELMKDLLGFEVKLTESQMRESMEKDFLGAMRQQEDVDEYLRQFHVQLSDLIEQEKGQEKLDPQTLEGILQVINMDAESTKEIVLRHIKRYENIGYPLVEQIYNAHYVADQKSIDKKLQAKNLLERANEVIGDGELKKDISKYLDTTRI